MQIFGPKFANLEDKYGVKFTFSSLIESELRKFCIHMTPWPVNSDYIYRPMVEGRRGILTPWGYELWPYLQTNGRKEGERLKMVIFIRILHNISNCLNDSVWGMKYRRILFTYPLNHGEKYIISVKYTYIYIKYVMDNNTSYIY